MRLFCLYVHCLYIILLLIVILSDSIYLLDNKKAACGIVPFGGGLPAGR